VPPRLKSRLTPDWLALPAPLRARLALASTGWRHLARTGGLALELSARAGGAGREALAPLAADILLWAFAENPLSGPLAAEILAAQGLPLPQASRRALESVAALWRTPAQADGIAYFERLAHRRDTQRLADFLAGRVAKEPSSLFWRDKAHGLGIYCGPGALGEGLLAAALDGLDALPGLAPVAASLAAQAAFLRGDAARCRELLAGLDAAHGPVFGAGFARARAALALFAAGEDALPELGAALRLAPWQAGLARLAADALGGARMALAAPPGPVLVALYTWNKAADLDATLSSLFASDLCGARVLVLNNGSTDDTPRVLDAWAARRGGDLSRVDLPVNIGAPAARNWIIATPEARASGSLVFLDDDVDLPPDWLKRLGAGLAAFPEAGVVGCKVADHQAPRLLQNAAGHLVIPEDAPEDAPEGEGRDRPDMDFRSLTPNPFRLHDAHLQGPDWGFFDFLGACASVTGCCHLFPRGRLEAPAAAGGGFSLALGPSQYDDFERDLRMLAGGRRAAYQGHLRVRHRKRSGISAQDGAAAASANGNRYKMQTMHPRAEVARLLSDQAQQLGDAADRAFALVDAAGVLT
jgi:hypothetical protein